MRSISLALVLGIIPAANPACFGQRFPGSDLQFLAGLTRDVVAASEVPPGSNGGGNWHVTNSCGFTLLTPGRNTYPAFWVRDFSMIADSGFVRTASLSNHLLLVCKAQNGPKDRPLANGQHLPPWAIPDHINYDGRPVFYPGTYASGDDQGDGTFGRRPPIDSHFEMVHIGWLHWKRTGDIKLHLAEVNGVSVSKRLENAFWSPAADAATGMAETSEEDRAVGFGFCDAEVHTGKLLFASLLRYRAAGELADLARASGNRKKAALYREVQAGIRKNLFQVFGNDPPDGWLRASTGISAQPDVWATLYALHLGLLDRKQAAAARKSAAEAVRRNTICFEGAVRHVPTDRDFSKNTSWERSVSPLNTYQNGGYWHTASGWLIEALWKEDRRLALQVFSEMLKHLRAEDFRKGDPHGAPWEVIGPGGGANRNPVYGAAVALPFSVLNNRPPSH